MCMCLGGVSDVGWGVGGWVSWYRVWEGGMVLCMCVL